MSCRWIIALAVMLVAGLSVGAAEVVLEDWEIDDAGWQATLPDQQNAQDLVVYHIASGSLEVTVAKTMITVAKKDLTLPPGTVKLSLEVTILGKGFKQVEVGMVMLSAGKSFDTLGRIKIKEGTDKQVLTFPINITPHIGSTWNKLSIRLYSAGSLKVRLDNLKAITAEQ